MNHTPAPWNIYEDNSGDVWHKPIITAWDEEGESSFDVAFPAYDLEHDEMVANARLIATAPDMLQALIRIVNDVPEPGESAQLTATGYNMACDAINKATGDNK